LAVLANGNSQALTKSTWEGEGAPESPMRLPEGKQRFFTGAVHTGDSIQIDFDVVLG